MQRPDDSEQSPASGGDTPTQPTSSAVKSPVPADTAADPTLRAAAGDDLLGRVLADRYLVIARLGEGGMGRVYLAEHVKMGRQCAIKVMNPSLMHDANSLARFAREASSASRILHPNVATVFDYGEAGKIVYLVMEHVDGESLSQILQREGALGPRRAIDIARQTADGLTAAHELGIVHRDLKPDNIIVSQPRNGKETAKIVDFGIAKALSDDSEDALTRSGLVIGTPEYMSPEQLLGDPTDARADVYSLGCILYEMLTGVQPFAAETREQMVRRRLHEPSPHVRDVVPSLPPALDALVEHMLAQSPRDRVPSAVAARDALDTTTLLAGWSPGPASVPHGAGDISLEPTAIMRRHTRRGLIVASAAFGVALVLSAIVVWPRHGPSTLPPAETTDTSSTPPTMAAASPVAAAPSLAAPTVDSAALAARHPALPAVDTAIRAPFAGLASAINSGSAQALTEKYPTLPRSVQSFLKQLSSSYDAVHARTAFGAAQVTGNRATLPITLHLTYRARGTGTPQQSDIRLVAQLAKQGDGWVIKGMNPQE